MRNTSRLLCLALLCTLSGALAFARIGNAHYVASRDPITDANTSTIGLPERYDTAYATVLSIGCLSSRPSVSLSVKSQIVGDAGVLPRIVYRSGSGPARNARVTAGLPGDLRQSGNTVTLSPADSQALLSGGMNSTRVAVETLTQGARATYVFPTRGLAQAWKASGRCG